MASRNFANSRIYTGHVKPVMIDCKFKVASTDSAGLGITSLIGPYVQNVFMHTTQTPGLGSSNPATPNIAITNPNPASGTIVIQLQDSYSRLYDMGSAMVSPLGTPVKIDNAAMTAGVAYVITTLGNATAAKWRAIGVPAGVTPAVGTVFIAASNGGSVNTSTSRVAPTAAAGSAIFAVEVVGSDMIESIPCVVSSQGFGSQIVLQCRSDSSSDASQIAAPADGTIISISLLLSDSSILVQGE